MPLDYSWSFDSFRMPCFARWYRTDLPAYIPNTRSGINKGENVKSIVSISLILCYLTMSLVYSPDRRRLEGIMYIESGGISNGWLFVIQQPAASRQASSLDIDTCCLLFLIFILIDSVDSLESWGVKAGHTQSYITRGQTGPSSGIWPKLTEHIGIWM